MESTAVEEEVEKRRAAGERGDRGTKESREILCRDGTGRLERTGSLSQGGRGRLRNIGWIGQQRWRGANKQFSIVERWEAVAAMRLTRSDWCSKACLRQGRGGGYGIAKDRNEKKRESESREGGRAECQCSALPVSGRPVPEPVPLRVGVRRRLPVADDATQESRLGHGGLISGALGGKDGPATPKANRRSVGHRELVGAAIQKIPRLCYRISTGELGLEQPGEPGREPQVPRVLGVYGCFMPRGIPLPPTAPICSSPSTISSATAA